MSKTLVVVSSLLAGAILSVASMGHAAPVNLGSFALDSNLFGDSIEDSDTDYAKIHWLNVDQVRPTTGKAVLGPSFNTGVANLGQDWSAGIIYTIHYNSRIYNWEGADFAVVSARYSANDSFWLSVSEDNGVTFSARKLFGPEAAISTGVPMQYFYGGYTSDPSTLFVTPIDISSFDISIEHSINAVKIEPLVELDLIRIAGFVFPRNPGLAGATPVVDIAAARTKIESAEKLQPTP